MSYINISKYEFDNFLKKFWFRELTVEEYKEIETDKVINEYCYWVVVNDKYLLLVYSSILKDENISRGYGGDSIKIVPRDRDTLDLVREKFSHINRTSNWTLHFQERVSEIIESLGYDTSCNLCKGRMFLRYNKKDNVCFLGCSKFSSSSKCVGARKLNN